MYLNRMKILIYINNNTKMIHTFKLFKEKTISSGNCGNTMEVEKAECKTIHSKNIDNNSKEAVVLSILIGTHGKSIFSTDEISHYAHAQGERISNRTVYTAIRNLRDLGVPLVGCDDGMFLASTVFQVKEFSEATERKGKALVKSFVLLKRSMLEMIDENPQESLFDKLAD